jgi:DHA1 family tetracycline resistance protein-like MFS transporter
MSFLNAVYGYFVLPESLAPHSRQNRMAWERANPFGSLRMLRSHPELSRLAGINFIEYVAHEVLPVVFTLYVIQRYHWNLAQVGWSLALVGASIAIVQMGLTQAIVMRLGERRTMILGLCFGVLSFAVIGYAPNAPFVLAGFALLALWGLAGPTAQSLMTHRVSSSEQGELQGALGGMRSLAMLVGPGLFSVIFAYSINARLHAWQLPGASWFVAAAMLLITVFLAFKVKDVRLQSGKAPPNNVATQTV